MANVDLRSTEPSAEVGPAKCKFAGTMADAVGAPARRNQP
jgi:hypothetical protein